MIPVGAPGLTDINAQRVLCARQYSYAAIGAAMDVQNKPILVNAIAIWSLSTNAARVVSSTRFADLTVNMTAWMPYSIVDPPYMVRWSLRRKFHPRRSYAPTRYSVRYQGRFILSYNDSPLCASHMWGSRSRSKPITQKCKRYGA
jgi:hypothetical protein